VIRVGAVDMGTNSTRLLVADVDGTELTEVERLLRITRLGDRVDADGRLSDAGMERVHAVLEGYAETARGLGAERVVATATSAVRDAANGREFLAEVERRHGFETRLLSGREEAELTYRGVTSRLAAGPGTLVCDIGGGSTELVLGGPDGVDDAVSLDIGCVRMSERCLHSDPPAAAELAALRETVAGLLPAELVRRAELLVGVAGTVTTLATIDLGLEREIPEQIDGHELAAPTVAALLQRLAAVPLAERRGVRGLMPERAPTIVAGAAIAAEVLRATGADAMVVSERDILHGAALAAADSAGG
jgi:exopolyphosphatase/guanosine-5'-triphosphate,3'-diphosphate pyrophosphatase